MDLLNFENGYETSSTLNWGKDPANPLGIGNKTFASRAWGWGPPNGSRTTEIDFHLDGAFSTIRGRVGVSNRSLNGCRVSLLLETEAGKPLKGSGTYGLGGYYDFADNVAGAATLRFVVTMTTNMHVGDIETCSAGLGDLVAT